MENMTRDWSNQSLSFPPLPPLCLQSTKKVHRNSQDEAFPHKYKYQLFTEHLHFQKIFLAHSTLKQVLNSSIHNTKNVSVSLEIEHTLPLPCFWFFPSISSKSVSEEKCVSDSLQG